MSSKRESRTVLLTLGRLPVALELARTLHSGGWRVLVADPYRWHLCRLSNTVYKSFKVVAPTTDALRYLDELEQIIEREQVSLVLPVSEESVFVSALKNRLPSSVELLCMEQSVLLQLHDKYCFARFARTLELSVPTTVLANDNSGCDQLMSMPFVVKPRLSCSGAGVRYGLAGDTLKRSELDGQHVVQQRLSGDACCTFSVATAGKTLLNVCYRSVLDAGSVAVCFEQITLPVSVNSFIETVVSTTNYSGMISFDFIQNEEGDWCAIECNPRATSGIHFVEHTDLLLALIDGKASTSDRLSGRRQEFWSCLMKVEGALFKGQINTQGWRNLFRTRDITFRMADLKPFFLMTFVLAPQLYKSFRSGKSVSEVLMSDVAWQDRRT